MVFFLILLPMGLEMEATELIAKLLEMNSGLMEMAMEGFPDDKMNETPDKDTNPAGWLLWHKTRVEDAIIAQVTGSFQIWMDDGWGEKFETAPAPDNMGFGQKPDEVKSMRFSRENLTGYAKAVRERTIAALDSLSPADLDREIPDFLPDTKIRIGELIGRGILLDNFQHSGQVCYLRGYYTGFGWLPY